MNVLVLTVGGSPQPLVTAVSQKSWDHIWFLCSADDPETGERGSKSMVTGHPEAGSDAADATIPAQAGLALQHYTIETVAPDHLDEVIRMAQSIFETARDRFEDVRIHADYTGGTKTMSAGLTLAAVEQPDVRLQLTTAVRTNLIRVEEGEKPSSAAASGIRLERAIKPLLRQFADYGYQEAATGFDELHQQLSQDDSSTLEITEKVKKLRNISRAFAAWDRHAYKEAKSNLFSRYSELAPYDDVIQALSEDKTREPLVIMDLYRNAERRAARSHYDEAMARGYRLIEWTAQWLLRDSFGWLTKDIPLHELPESCRSLGNAGPNGGRQLPLQDAWTLVETMLPDSPLTQMMQSKDHHGKTHRQELKNLLQSRNNSYLAHGSETITEGKWERLREWLDQHLLPALQEEAHARGRSVEVPQLPTQPPRDLQLAMV